MSLSEKELQLEKEYLNKVMSVLYTHLKKSEERLERSKEEVIELNKTMMDDIGNDVQSLGKFVDAYSYLVEIGSRAGAMHESELEYARLKNMEETPYFARMDFRADGESKDMKVYIGVGSLIDTDTLDFYVFDWRSPIAGMYYDYELGKAEYEAPRGIVNGEVTLKRQFKIWKGEILSAYESSVAIEDDVLSEALSKSADSKMKDIVCTIQREQNKIIRDKSSKYLIAFGPAGSGKTSVAMQRAAFFLYAYRDTIEASNLMIFSPNNVFSDYISEVLPRLGEANIKSSTFTNYAESIFGDRYKFLPTSEFLEFSVNPYGVREKAAKIKASKEFCEKLKAKIASLSGESPNFPDLIYGDKCVIRGKEMDRLYTKDFSYLSVSARMNKLFLRVTGFAREEFKRRTKIALENLAKSDVINLKEEETKLKWQLREERREFLERAKSVLTAKPEKIYLDALKEMDYDVFEYTRHNLKHKKVAEAEDAAPLLYVYSATRDIKNEVKYLIVDEAQDYTLLHFECMKNCFKNANITFLGDSNQAVCPVSPLLLDSDIKSVFGEATVTNLKKSYRSTKEISAFTGKILGLENVDYMNREGEKVSMTTLKSEDDYQKAMVIESLNWKKEGRTSAIIYPTLSECREIYEKYGKGVGLKLITGDEKEFITGNVIIPAYMAKGLEFDAVAIPYKSYEREELKHIFYTATTRALHVLKLYKF